MTESESDYIFTDEESAEDTAAYYAQEAAAVPAPDFTDMFNELDQDDMDRFEGQMSLKAERLDMIDEIKGGTSEVAETASATGELLAAGEGLATVASGEGLIVGEAGLGALAGELGVMGPVGLGIAAVGAAAYGLDQATDGEVSGTVSDYGDYAIDSVLDDLLGG